jgi:1,4-alpha-glucan branching enzyme
MNMRPRPHRPFTKPTVFRCRAANAHRVALQIRSLNGGAPATHPMQRAIDGTWHVTLELERGRYLYRFLIDNHPALDPTARGTVHNEHGAHSMREIGY